MMKLSRILSSSILAAALAACGSGGGDSPAVQTTDNAVPQTPATQPSTGRTADNVPKEPKLTVTALSDNSVKRLYELPYSTVAGTTQIKQADDGSFDEHTNIQIAGTPTLESALPKMGKVVYRGDAFNEMTNPAYAERVIGARPGYLEYTIDFDERTGHGKISSIQLDFGEVMLRQGKLEKINLDGQEVMGVRSNADIEMAVNTGDPDNPVYTRAGNYELGVFGPNADSIAGKLTNSSFNIGFGGTREDK